MTDTGAGRRPDTVASDLDSLLAHVAGLSALSGCDVRSIALPEPPPLDFASALAAALARPRESPPLAEVARGRANVAIITSDATRAVPTREILPALLAQLAQGGIAAEQVTVVFGGGAHRPVTSDEVTDMLGDAAGAVQAVAHDARASECVSIGRTPRGNDVRINRVVAEAGLKIALGVVEAHEFAGFSGGRKAILPAVADYASILENHRLELIGDPAARAGVLDGNPVHEEMVAALRLAGLDFIVNVVLDSALRPVAVAAGDPEAAHDELVDFVRRTATIEPPPSAELIVTGPDAPLDINFYQSVKTLVALEPLVDEETTVVLLSRCREGLGGADLLRPFAGATDPAEALARSACDYTVEQDHAYFIARFLSRCPRVVTWCPGVSDDDLRTLRLDPAASVDDAVGRARRQLSCRRARPTVLLFPRPQRALFAAGGGSARPVH